MPPPSDLLVHVTRACAGEAAYQFDVECSRAIDADRLFWRGAHGEAVADEPLAGAGAAVQAGTTYSHSASRAGTSAVVWKDGEGEVVVAAAHADALTAPCEPGPEVERIFGRNRYDTAAKVALRFHREPRVAYLVGGEAADALALAGLPPSEAGPVLLTAKDRLPQETKAALAELRPRCLRVLGGTQAIFESVLAEAADAAGLDV
jgi:hypothetical protein